MTKSRLILCFTALAGVYPLAAQSGSPRFDESKYVGNVVGSVIDSKTGRGIRGASVLLIKAPWRNRSGSAGWTEHLRNALLGSSVRRGSTDSSGQFIVNDVPTPYPFETYTVVAMAPGYKVQVFDQIPVLPGAVMSLDCPYSRKGGGSCLWQERPGGAVPLQSREETPYSADSSRRPDCRRCTTDLRYTRRPGRPDHRKRACHSQKRPVCLAPFATRLVRQR
jgi:Carboxypeptidase regulatory-like domain